MNVSTTSGGCLQIKLQRDEISKPVLLVSDIHYDNPKCDRKLLKTHLDLALQREATILIGGDLFCAMQGKYDPRRNKGDIEPEFNVPNYLDNLVDKVAEFLYPYRANIQMIAQGNHESNMLNRLETDLTARLIDALGGNIHNGGYHGFVRWLINVSDTSRRNVTMYFHHGTPGGVVTRGTPWVQRFASIAPDANVIWTGDSHDRFDMDHPQYRLTQNGTMKVVTHLHIKTGTYKQEFEQPGGWAIEAIRMPKSLGGYWLQFQEESYGIVPRAIMT